MVQILDESLQRLVESEDYPDEFAGLASMIFDEKKLKDLGARRVNIFKACVSVDYPVDSLTGQTVEEVSYQMAKKLLTLLKKRYPKAFFNTYKHFDDSFSYLGEKPKYSIIYSFVRLNKESD